jgi:Na+-transporting NADH:ubiquinone oxidoreductase subunit C
MKEQIKMILFVIILGIAASGILMGMNVYTKDKILANEDQAFKKTLLDAFDIEYTDTDIVEVYDANIEAYEKEGQEFYKSATGDVGFRIAGSGLWGPIRGFLTLEKDLTTIKGIQIIYQEETPGLGGIVAEAWYLDQFKGKVFDPDFKLVKADDQANADNEVDAITGATMTSSGFEALLNAGYTAGKEILVK